MRRLVVSLFGRKDDKQQRKEINVTSKSSTHGVSSSRLRLQPPPSNSSASSSTSFSVSTRDDGIPPSPPSPKHSIRWKSVFRNRKGSKSSLRRSTASAISDDQYVPYSRSSMITGAVSSATATDDDEDLSPPVPPFVRNRSSSRTSESSPNSNTNSPRSSRSSLVPLPPIPASPPPLTPHVYMHTVIIRSLARNPYISPHPLLTTPAGNSIITNNNSVTASDFYLYPRSINAPNTLPPPLLTLRQQSARLRLLERLKTHIFSAPEERAISLSSSLSRLSSQPPLTSTPLALSQSASSLRLTSDRETLQEVEATNIHNVDRTGVSRGLARWVRRGGFEERCVVWTMDETAKSYIFTPIQGGPVAALEFSEGMEAFAGLVDEDEPVAALAGSASCAIPYNSLNDRLTTSITPCPSTTSIGLPNTPSLSQTPSPAPSSISLSHIMPTNPPRPIPSSYHPPTASKLQRVPSLPKRRGVRFAPSVTTAHTSSPTPPVQLGNKSSQSLFDSTVSPSPFERTHARRRSNDSNSPLGGPVIVHPSTPADGLEIEQHLPSPSSRGLVVSPFGAPAPKQRAPFPRAESERERAQHERDEREREQARRRKASTLQAQQIQAERKRLQGEVAAARKRRESYKLDGGSTSVRAQAVMHAGDASSLSYSSSSTGSSSQNQHPPAPKRITTDSGVLGGSVGRRARGGQMWDLSVNDVSETLPTSPFVKGPTGERTRENSTQRSGAATPRPSSLRQITTHATGASSQPRQSSSASNFRNVVMSNSSRTSLSANVNSSSTAVDKRSAPVPGGLGTGNSLSSVRLSLNDCDPTPAKSSGTSIPLPPSGGGLPRRRSLAPGDPSHTQRPAPQTRNSRESHLHGQGALLTPENLRASRSSSPLPVPRRAMPYGTQMPMFVVQPVAVPVYLPMPTAAAGVSATAAPVPGPAGMHHHRFLSFALSRSQSQSSGLASLPKPRHTQPLQ